MCFLVLPQVRERTGRVKRNEKEKNVKRNKQKIYELSKPSVKAESRMVAYGLRSLKYHQPELWKSIEKKPFS